MGMWFPCTLTLGLLAVCTAQFLEPLSTTTTPWPSTEEKSKDPQKPATYWITYSNTVRPGHSLDFQVHIFKGSSPVEISIVLKDTAGQEVLSHGPVEVSPMVLSEIKVPIPLNVSKPNPDSDRWYYSQDYTVEVKGHSDEITIKEKGRVSYQEKAFSIFVQTDKAMYKPSQTVKFRTLAMTPDMKVMRNVQQDIIVYDSKGNRILQYKGVEAPEKLGVVEKSFNLASSVPTGNWKIKVTIEGVEEEKEFEVSDYVLPRFEVEVDGKSFGATDDLYYEFTVRAKYTFGKPVTEGSVNVEITLPSYSYRQDRAKPLKKRGELDKNGELFIQITLADLKRMGESYTGYTSNVISEWWDFEITANVTETRTGKTHSGTHNVNFYNTPIKMAFLGITPDAFKSGLDFTAYLEIKRKDDTLFSPQEVNAISVKMKVSYTVPVTTTTSAPTTTSKAISGGSNTFLSLAKPILHDPFFHGGRYPRTEQRELELDKAVYKVPETGWVVFSFRVPDEATDFNIEATTESPFDEVTAYHYGQKSQSPTNSFLQLSVTNKKAKVGDSIKVQVKSTDSIKMLNYQVFSKGLLLHHSMVKGPSNNLLFDFVATKAMSPSMSIVAFYVRDDGEFVVDALSLSVDGLFDKAVKAEFNKEKVKPGESVNLVVTGEPDSVVFLLAVDKSVKLLKSGNDITQDMVREELSTYDYGNYGNWRYMFICGWPSYYGGEDASTVFSNAGVNVMTDGLVYSHHNDDNSHSISKTSWKGGSDRSPLTGIQMFAGKLVPGAGTDVAEGSHHGNFRKPKRVRKAFPENWLWRSVIIRRYSQGTVSIPLVSPDTITTWLASVFSVNPRSGLSIAEKPAEMVTFRNMFVSLELPSSIVRGEDFCFPASVFSYYPGEIPVLLTLEPSEGFANILIKKEKGKITQSQEQLYYSYFMGFMEENDVKTVTYCFTPTKIGYITILVSALTDVDGLSDAVERKLRVKPEGFPRATTVSYMVTPTDGMWTMNVPVQFPDDTVNGSQRISVNIAGNLLGPVFENLDDVLQMPYGCGEQNMINFSPIMSLVDFFYTTNTITEEFRQKAVDYMLKGYQKEILYEHGQTGGYSTFGNQDNPREKASMWLTAFVTKCFSQAEILDVKYGNILAMDVMLIYRSAKWMVSSSNQNYDGQFVENGRVFNKGLQGGSSKGIALTSYTVISLYHALKVLEAHPELRSTKIQDGMDKAVRYLETNLDTLTDPYDVCITTYALTLVGSGSRNGSFVMMENMAKKGFGMTYWERPKQEEKTVYYWSRDSDAINIEMTSYALLTYSLLGIGTQEGLPIIRWLSKQKGPNGGFISTQDTVIGIEALTSVAKDLYGAEFVPMTISVNTMGVSGSKDFQVTKDNEMVLQRNDIPYEAGSEIEIVAKVPSDQDTSKTTVLVDVVFNYNVELETQTLSYDMKHEIKNHDEGFDLWVTVKTTNGELAGFSILEVEIPAGYIADELEIKKINSEIISKVEQDGNNVNIYINTGVIGARGVDIKVAMVASGGTLAKAQAKSYRIYDYYETSIEQRNEYFLIEEGNFCTKVPTYGVCQYE